MIYLKCILDYMLHNVPGSCVYVLSGTQLRVMRPKKPAHHIREYIDRKNKNAIFTHTYLHTAFSKLDNFCYGDTQYPTNHISTKSCQAFSRYKLSMTGLVSLVFFFFSSKRESYHKLETGHLIPLKFSHTKRWWKGASWYQE